MACLSTLRIRNVQCAGVDACDCTRYGGCANTVQESALKAGSGGKVPCRTVRGQLILRPAFWSERSNYSHVCTELSRPADLIVQQALLHSKHWLTAGN